MSSWPWLVADNGCFCPCRIEVRSADVEILKTAHIERIASSLGKSISLNNEETVWGKERPCSPGNPEPKEKKEMDLFS